MFIENKVALITGGASGIGLEITKALLKNNAKGVAIADINEELGHKITKQLKNEFGTEKIIFIKTDVADKEQFENAMKRTVETFIHFDILVNNAGIFNDNLYEQEVSVNLIGVIHGCRLAMETYLKCYKSTSEGVIVNTASIFGLQGFPSTPIYTATKHAVVGLTKSLSAQLHYDATKIKIIAICPGITNTPLLMVTDSHYFNGRCFSACQEYFCNPNFIMQSLDKLGKAIIPIINEGENGSIWVIDGENVSSVHIPEIKELKKIKIL